MTYNLNKFGLSLILLGSCMILFYPMMNMLDMNLVNDSILNAVFVIGILLVIPISILYSCKNDPKFGNILFKESK